MTRTISGNNVNLIKERGKITQSEKGSKFIQHIGEIQGKSTPLIHIYTSAHFTGFLEIL